jgi:cell division protein FtsI (penicillin-binding protein 3)
VGLHQGGQVAAPAFNRIAQQVLEYMHTPHDTEIPADRQTLVALAKNGDHDLEEGSPDHPGESFDESQPATDALADSRVREKAKPSATPTPAASGTIVTAALRHAEPTATFVPPTSLPLPAPASVALPTNGTVVMDVEQGGIVVPSFLGKSVRSSIEIAQGSGLELDIVGSGRGMDQLPAPGSHVASGARIMVKFGR